MNEADFIIKLQERAKQQEKIINDTPFPNIFSTVTIWLGKHPWRIILPISILLTFIFRLIFGSEYTDFILSIFRGL